MTSEWGYYLGGLLLLLAAILLVAGAWTYSLPADLNYQQCQDPQQIDLQQLIEVLRNPGQWPANLTPPIRLGGPLKSRHDAAVLIAEQFGPKAAIAVPALIEALADPDEFTRRAVLYALQRIGAEAKAAIPALIETLADESEFVRWEAASLLNNLEADPKTPDIARVLSKLDSYSRSKVVGSLGKIGQNFQVNVPPLIAALADDDEDAHIREIQSLKAEALPALIEALDYREEMIRVHAAEHLSAFGISAIPHLIRCMHDPEPLVQMTAIDSLGKIGVTSDEVIQLLIDVLDDELLGLSAAQAIGSIGPLAGAAGAAALKKLSVESPIELVCVESAFAAWRVDGSIDSSVEVLCRVIRGCDEMARLRAIDLLKQMKADSRTALPNLIAVLEDWNGDVSSIAAEVIGDLGELAKPAVPALRRAFAAADYRTRLNAANAIWRVDRQTTAEAVHVLMQLVDGEGFYTEQIFDEGSLRINRGKKRGNDRVQAVEALGEIGTEARVAIDKLILTLRDDDENVRNAARRALDRIEYTND